MGFCNPKIDLTPLYKENPLPRLRKQSFVKKERVKKKIKKKPNGFKLYKKSVWKLTEDVAHQIPHIEYRGFKTFHIDHKISIHYGYKNNIPVEHIAHISNLEMLHHKFNMKKGIKHYVNSENEWIIANNAMKTISTEESTKLSSIELKNTENSLK